MTITLRKSSVSEIDSNGDKAHKPAHPDSNQLLSGKILHSRAPPNERNCVNSELTCVPEKIIPRMFGTKMKAFFVKAPYDSHSIPQINDTTANGRDSPSVERLRMTWLFERKGS